MTAEKNECIKEFMSERGDNFKAVDEVPGVRKFQCMATNLWKRGTSGRLIVIACLVVVPLLLVSSFVGCNSKDDDDNVVQNIVANMVPITPDQKILISKYEVTQSQWAYIMGDCPAAHKGKNNPVETVTWNDCQLFIKRLNALPEMALYNLVFRLPSEQEWEYACRAGSEGKYCRINSKTEITDKTLGEVAWYKENSGMVTHPVGQKQPNSLGLYDMHGNVWEWTQTREGDGYIYRGGSCRMPDWDCASSWRSKRGLRSTNSDMGLRLCAIRKAVPIMQKTR